MKKNRLFMIIIMLVFLSCGPVVISSRPNHPPPAWFYPNRVELVRYIYFPEHAIYYDLTLSNYLYLNNGVWLRANVLPPRYRTVNLSRAKYVRIKGYRGDNIRKYHNENNLRSSIRTSKSTTKTRRN